MYIQAMLPTKKPTAPDVAARLRDALSKSSKKGVDLARALNVTPQAVSGWLRTGRIDKARIPEVARELGVTSDYLLAGETTAMRDERPVPPPGRHDQGRKSGSLRPIVAWEMEEELGEDYVFIPRLDIKLSAGNGHFVWHVDEKAQRQAFRKGWCERLGIKPENAATMVASGSSMEDRIQDGDSLVIDYKAIAILHGKVFAISYQREIFVKRLFKLPDGGIKVVSDNPDKAKYPDWDIGPDTLDKLQIIGRVVAVSGGV